MEVIGEAAKKVGEAFRSQHPGMPWSQMARMRDVLIHHYFGVNLSVVWKTIQRDLPQLLYVLRTLIEGTKTSCEGNAEGPPNHGTETR